MQGDLELCPNVWYFNVCSYNTPTLKKHEIIKIQMSASRQKLWIGKTREIERICGVFQTEFLKTLFLHFDFPKQDGTKFHSAKHKFCRICSCLVHPWLTNVMCLLAERRELHHQKAENPTLTPIQVYSFVWYLLPISAFGTFFFVQQKINDIRHWDATHRRSGFRSLDLFLGAPLEH